MKIKICGLTRVEEACYLNRNQIDFAGMVLFHPKSKRNITISQAERIMKELEPSIKSVAVVVSPSLSQIQAIEKAGFAYIQIHGSMPTDMLKMIHIPVLRAFNITNMAEYEKIGEYSQIAGYVFDAQEPGSGKTFDWNLLNTISRDKKLFIIAGGLTKENVAKAVEELSPDAVDVSSGVEYEDGDGKDPARIDAFVRAVRTVGI